MRVFHVIDTTVCQRLGMQGRIFLKRVKGMIKSDSSYNPQSRFRSLWKIWDCPDLLVIVWPLGLPHAGAQPSEKSF